MTSPVSIPEHQHQHQHVPLLTTAKVWTVFFVQLNEAYQITLLLPMVVFMCRDFGIQPKDLGIYTSILNASFCMCQFLVSYIWGSASDKYGRKHTLIIGTFLSTAATTFFGFSTSYVHAMVARCLSGFFQGNLSVIKSYLADITNSENRSYAFSYLAVSYGMGNILGSMFGGLLIKTHNVDLPDGEYRKTESIFDWPLFNRYPFLPACLIGAFISLNALIWIILNVKNGESEKESNLLYSSTSDIEKFKIKGIDESRECDASHSTNLTRSIQSLPMARGSAARESRESRVALFDKMETSLKLPHSLSIIEIGAGMASLPTIPRFNNINFNFLKNKQRQRLLDKDKHKHKHKDQHSIGSSETELIPIPNPGTGSAKEKLQLSIPEELVINSLYELCRETRLLVTLCCYCYVSFCIMMYREMGPVYQAQCLLFSSQEIGFLQAWSGLVLLVFTLSCQKRILRKFEHSLLSQWCAAWAAVMCICMPSIYWLTKLDNSLWNNKIVHLLIGCIVEGVICMFISIVYVCSLCFTNNSIPDSHIGRANGLAQASGSLLKSAGPVLTGFIWSESYVLLTEYGNDIAVYYAYLPAAIGFFMMCAHIRLFIPADMQFTYEKRQYMRRLKRLEMKEKK